MFPLVAILCIGFLGNINSLQIPENRIINGIKANLDDFPFLVQIRNNIGAYTCAGSIISDVWILTAGHCVNDSATVTVRTKLSNEEPKRDNWFQVIANKIHPNYYEKTTETSVEAFFDIGLLLLDRSIQFSALVGPVALFDENDLGRDDNVQITFAGWGCNENTFPRVSIDLHYMTGQTAKCEDSSLDNPLCVYGTASGCDGDSGSPVISNDGRQVGVISKGLPGMLSFVTRVSNFRSWIRDTAQV